MLYLCLNDEGPRTDVELWYAAFGNVMGSIATANLFGELAVLLMDLNEKSDRFQKKVDAANGAMQNLKLGTVFQNKTQSYFRTTQESQNQQEEMKQFLRLLPPSVRSRIM